MSETRWMRHHWTSRTAATVYGAVPRRCAWWKRAWYLVTGR